MRTLASLSAVAALGTLLGWWSPVEGIAWQGMGLVVVGALAEAAVEGGE